MWKKKIISLALLSALLLPCVSQADSGTTTISHPATVTMQWEQYSRLKQITIEQEMTLDQLEMKLNLLEKNSTEQTKESIELLNQLNESKALLKTTNNKLANAEISLQEADVLLTKNAQSLVTLKKQIESLEHKIAVLRRQRDMWAGVAYLSLGVLGYVSVTK